MSAPTLTYHRRARWALEQLPEPEEKAIRLAIESLLRLPPNQWPDERVKLLSADKSIYLLYATRDWRVFFTLSPSGEIAITSVAHEETLKWFAEGTHRASVQG